MAQHDLDVPVSGPWSLATSRSFWEVFTPAALGGQPEGAGLRTVFCSDADWRHAEVEVNQDGPIARVRVSGEGDLDAAAAQACRFLSLDVDASDWPGVGRRDRPSGSAGEPVTVTHAIGDAAVQHVLNTLAEVVPPGSPVRHRSRQPPADTGRRSARRTHRPHHR